MARRLKAIAKWINENTDHKAVIDMGYCNTDRTPRGFRYITSPGKGRYGNRLTVKTPSGEIVCQHNSAETYAQNEEVERWLDWYFIKGNQDTSQWDSPTKHFR